MRRTFVLVMMSAMVGVLGFAAAAAASYGAGSAPLLWGEQTWSYASSAESAAILDPSATVASCDNSGGDQLCSFGRPALSPDGGRIVVSWHPEGSGFPGSPGAGTLELLDSSGANPQMLPQLTASDTQPAFLPDGNRIVFTGRATPGAQSQLYEVNIDGTGLRQLTFRGGSWAAPCANGAIVFERGADLWLIPARGTHWTRIVHGGSEPDCAPNSRQAVYATHRHSRLALVGLNGRGSKLLPHGSGAEEEPDRPGYLFSPSFSPDGRSIAYIRTYDALQQDGTRDELDISDLSGRIHARRDVADEAGGSIGYDGDQSLTQYVSW